MRFSTKIFNILALLAVFNVAMIPLGFGQGVIEDKTNLENRGPGNLDAPTEPDPKKKTEVKAEDKAEAKTEEKKEEKKDETKKEESTPAE